jgi:hypothetical protein
MGSRSLYRGSWIWSWCTYLALVSVTAGCTSDSQHGTVAGKVTLAGQPLDDGVIRFAPADGQTAAVEAPIANGQFRALVPVGKMRVTVTSSKVVGKRKAYDTPDSRMVDVVEERVPARYNARSELTLDVTAGEQPHDFELKSGD